MHGKGDLHQHFIDLDVGRQQTLEEFGCGNLAFALGGFDAHTRPHCNRNRRQFGSRVGVGQVAADRSPIADLRMGDVRQRVGE